MMFLHYLVTRNDREMLYKFFKVQWEYPTKMDWTETVKEDFDFFGMELNIDELKKYKKLTFSKLLKKKIKNAAFEYLLDKKDQHSKMDGITYDKKLKKQNYLDHINPTLARLLFKFRCRMINVKMNFKKANADFNCPLCVKIGEFYTDSQQHLLCCKAIIQKSDILSRNKTVKYEHIFDKNIEKMTECIKLLKIALQIRNEE